MVVGYQHFRKPHIEVNMSKLGQHELRLSPEQLRCVNPEGVPCSL